MHTRPEEHVTRLDEPWVVGPRPGDTEDAVAHLVVIAGVALPVVASVLAGEFDGTGLAIALPIGVATCVAWFWRRR